MHREAYGKPQIPALKPQGFRTDTEHRILGEHFTILFIHCPVTVRIAKHRKTDHAYKLLF